MGREVGGWVKKVMGLRITVGIHKVIKYSLGNVINKILINYTWCYVGARLPGKITLQAI